MSTIKGSVHPNDQQKQNKHLTPSGILTCSDCWDFYSCHHPNSIEFYFIYTTQDFQIRRPRSSSNYTQASFSTVVTVFLHSSRKWFPVRTVDIKVRIIMEDNVTLYLVRHFFFFKFPFWMFWAKYKVDSLWWDGPVADASKTQQTPKLYHGYILLGVNVLCEPTL